MSYSIPNQLLKTDMTILERMALEYAILEQKYRIKDGSNIDSPDYFYECYLKALKDIVWKAEISGYDYPLDK